MRFCLFVLSFRMSLEQKHLSHLSHMEDGELRNINKSSVLEIKWCFEYEDKEDEFKWVMATIHEYDTGRTHRIWNCDNEDEKTEESDFKDVPIVSIHYTNEKNEYHDICFLDDHVIYDIETGTLLLWRFFGDTYDENDSEDAPPILMHCESEEDLRRQINDFIPSIFVNILKKYRKRLNSLPQAAIDIITKQTIQFKNLLSDRLFEYFIGKDGMKEGRIMCLTEDDVDELIHKCLEDL